MSDNTPSRHDDPKELVTRQELRSAINLMIGFTMEATLMTSMMASRANTADIQGQKEKLDKLMQEFIEMGYIDE